MAADSAATQEPDTGSVKEDAGPQHDALSGSNSKTAVAPPVVVSEEEPGTVTTAGTDNTTSEGASPDSARSERQTTPLVAQSPPPAAAPPAPAVVAPQSQGNDAVSALQSMFPGMDATIISEVLAAHGGDADAASMALLELNNPEAAPPQVAAGRATTAAAAQLQADEEYARQLMMQMEREHQQEYGRPLGSAPQQRTQQAASSQPNSSVNYDQLNYVPRQRNRHGQLAGSGTASPQMQQQQQYSQDGQHSSDGQQQAGLGQWLGGQTGPDGRWKHQDELDQLTEQFNKFADTGKKTFNSFLSKAKDKYAQTAQQRALQAQSSQQQQGANEGSGIRIAGLKIPNIPSPWQGGTGFRPGEKPMSPEREELRSGPLNNDSRSSVMRDYSSSPSRPSASNYHRNSFDDDSPPIQINKPLPSGTQSQAIRTASSTNAPTLSSSPATATPGFSTSPPHLTQQQPRNSFTSGSPAKVQMLPRQTINLLDQTDKDRNSRSASPAVVGGAAGAGSSSAKKDRDYDDDSDSDVEYVRNPFNDDD